MENNIDWQKLSLAEEEILNKEDKLEKDWVDFKKKLTSTRWRQMIGIAVISFLIFWVLVVAILVIPV